VAKRPDTIRLHDDIRREFSKLSRAGYKPAYIIKMLANNYFRATTTIRDIVYKK